MAVHFAHRPQQHDAKLDDAWHLVPGCMRHPQALLAAAFETNTGMESSISTSLQHVWRTWYLQALKWIVHLGFAAAYFSMHASIVLVPCSVAA